MKRTAALTLILVVLLLGAFSSSAGARDAGQLSSDDTFHSLARDAARPVSGQDLYDNIHEYMWKSVYVMGKIDYTVPPIGDGQLIFIRTWVGDGHLPGQRGADFVHDQSSAFRYKGVTIGGDAIIILPPGMEMPHTEFELVGTVCAIQKFHSSFGVGGGAAFPIICIPPDGKLRIRELPVFIERMWE